MVQITEKDFEEFRKLCDKHGIKYKTEDEYRESAYNLINLADISLKMAIEEKQREHRLEREPKGFAIESKGRTCSLCKSNIDGEMWYDKWGMKCMNCQEALNKKIVPGYVFKDPDNEKHVTASTLSWKFDIRSSTIRKLVRHGKLKAREIPGSGSLVFLRKENPDIVTVIETEKAAKARAT